jgi:hypothetical protein
MQSKTGKPTKSGAERRDKLGERLRENLRRRKMQARERAGPKEPAATPPSKSAGK